MVQASSGSVSRTVGAATMVGAVAIAVTGWLPSVADPAGATMRPVILAAVTGTAALLLLLGAVTWRRAGVLGRLGSWGSVLAIVGFSAMITGSLLTLTDLLLPAIPGEIVAAAGIPVWASAHLVYVGGTLLGLGCLAGRQLPRPTAVLLAAQLPVIAVGVPIGLALSAHWSAIVTWLATEGQLGIGWLLLGLQLWQAGPRRPGGRPQRIGSRRQRALRQSVGL